MPPRKRRTVPAKRATEPADPVLMPGGTPWAGGHPARWRPPDGLSVLDAGFPIRHALPALCLREMAAQRPDRPALAGVIARARAAEHVPQESFIAAPGVTGPLPVIEVPRIYHELEPDTLTREFELELPEPEMTP